MKKPLKILIIVFGAIVCLGILGRITDALQYYRSPTPSNEPTIKTGSRFFASNLVSPKRFDFICFHANDSLFGRQIWVFRVCGIGGDIVEIKNGELLINNEQVDKKFTLQHYYIISKQEFEKINDITDIPQEEVTYRTQDTLIIPLQNDFFLKNKINAKRMIFDTTHDYDQAIFKTFSKRWSLDNFGPVKVPKDTYFVLGDNRHNAMDSRYIGFINKKEVVGTVVWK